MNKDKWKGFGLGILFVAAISLLMMNAVSYSIEHEYFRVPLLTDSSNNTAVDLDSKTLPGDWSGGNWSEDSLGFDPANQSELDSHTGDTSNPHSTDAGNLANYNLDSNTLFGGSFNGSHKVPSSGCDAYEANSSGQYYFNPDNNCNLTRIEYYNGTTLEYSDGTLTKKVYYNSSESQWVEEYY